MSQIPIADWVNFFVAEIGASAALTGLVFVAISINLVKILSVPQLPGRAAETLVILVGALVLTSAGLVPDQPAAFLGLETLAIGLLLFLAPLTLQLRSPKMAEELSALRKLVRPAVSTAASLPMIVAGLLLMLGSGAGLYWIAVGVILSLVAGVVNAWVLLIEILR